MNEQEIRNYLKEIMNTKKSVTKSVWYAGIGIKEGMAAYYKKNIDTLEIGTVLEILFNLKKIDIQKS